MQSQPLLVLMRKLTDCPCGAPSLGAKRLLKTIDTIVGGSEAWGHWHRWLGKAFVRESHLNQGKEPAQSTLMRADSGQKEY